MAPRASCPDSRASRSAITSAWAPPAAWVNPLEMTEPLADTSLHSTRGLGSDNPTESRALPEYAGSTASDWLGDVKVQKLCL